MSKEMAVTTANDLQVYTKSNLMGVAASLSSSDIQIPSLMLMQANSTFVQEDDNINSGDFIHSISKERWGGKDKDDVELIFFDMFKTQIISDVTKTKEWVKTSPWTEDMELEEYESVVDGRTLRREKCFNYACFRALDIREVTNPITGEAAYAASPIIVKFKGGSLKNGKRLNQMFQDYADFGAPSWATTFHLVGKFEENDKGKYWTYDFKRGAQSLPEQQMVAEKLCKQMQAAKTINVVDEEEGEINVTPKVKNYADDIV